MSLRKRVSEVKSPKSLPPSNQKITSGVYHEDYPVRLQAYNLSPTKLFEKSELINRISNTYEVELKYMAEYISLLKKKLSTSITPEEVKSDLFLRSEISSLYERLKNEQMINLHLVERIDLLNYERYQSKRSFNENSYINESSYISNTKIAEFRQEVFAAFNECIDYYIKDNKKAEARVEKAEFDLNKIKNELNYLKKSWDQRKEEFEWVVKENESLREMIKELDKDLRFYQEENRKQREIIKELSDESENMKGLSKIKPTDGISADLLKERSSMQSSFTLTEDIREKSQLSAGNEAKISEKHEEASGGTLERLKALEFENEKLKQQVTNLQEDNQKLEVITTNLQDLIIQQEENPNKNFSPEFRSNGTRDNLNQKLNELVQENESLAYSYNKALQDLNEAKSQLEDLKSTLSTHELVSSNIDSLTKENALLNSKCNTLAECKIKLFDLITLLSEKDAAEQELLLTSRSRNPDHTSLFSQLRTEIESKSAQIQALITSVFSLD